MGECLVDLNTGIIYDYSRKGGVLYREFLMPERAKYDSLEKLLADGERLEKRQNSRVGRELVVGIPHDLPQGQQIDLAREFSLELERRYGCGVVIW